MIRQSSLALGELIAVTNPVVKPTEIIQGLNGVSQGLHAYSENFRQEIIAATSGDETEHTAVLDTASDRLAEIIRGAMENISAYGKPLALAIGKNAQVCYSKEQLRSIAGEHFKHQFVWLDDPFFDSPVYPKEVKDKSFTYTNISLDVLKGLTFEYPTEEQVMEFVNSSHADVVEILRQRDCSVTAAAFCLTDLEALHDWFVTNREGNFDFTRVKMLDSERVLKAYVILTKMYASDGPVPWLKAGSLEDYRVFVNLLWNGMTTYLLHLRNVVINYRDAQLVVVDDGPVRLVDGKSRTEPGVKMLEANTKVYYTDAVLEAITGKNCSMSEVVLGYYWDRLTSGQSRSSTDMLKNPEVFQAKANEYYNYVNEKLSTHAASRFVQTGLVTILEFISTNENIMHRLHEIRGETGEMLSSWVRDTFTQELERCFIELNGSGVDFASGLVAEGEEGVSISDVVMSSRIVPQFLRALRCNLAADLLEDTFVTQAQEDNVADQRQRLAVSVINLIVKLSLEA